MKPYLFEVHVGTTAFQFHFFNWIKEVNEHGQLVKTTMNIAHIHVLLVITHNG